MSEHSPRRADLKRIFAVIARYADTYCEMERLQGEGAPLQTGDQKTGVIAEFYGRLYVESQYPRPGYEVSYAAQGEAWDIEVRRRGRLVRKIQVKGVSAHADYDRVSAIHPGWNDLYLLRLDHKLQPEGFWVIDATSVNWARRKLKHRTMPKHDKPESGSAEFHDREPKLDELLAILRQSGAKTRPRASTGRPGAA